MPWKLTQDPYKIWLSEIILQQTRVAQGQPYYEKFVKQYPTIQELAAAPQDEVMKLWQGLGYYSRARNMHHTAKTVVDDFGGIFPNTYKDVLSLKGVGKYTAAAIMSFAYGESHPVVDGNVLRVISRLHGITDAIDDKKTIDKIYELSEKYIKNVDPAKYNQAIMDIGALVCKPKNPTCISCPFSEVCSAKKDELIDQVPYKAKKIKKTTRYFHYLHVTSHRDNMLLKLRSGKGIWQGLYDMPLIEKTDSSTLEEEDVNNYLTDMGISKYKWNNGHKTYKHILSHQTLFVVFHKVKVDDLKSIGSEYIEVEKQELGIYGMPILISNYLKEGKDLFS